MIPQFSSCKLPIPDQRPAPGLEGPASAQIRGLPPAWRALPLLRHLALPSANCPALGSPSPVAIARQPPAIADPGQQMWPGSDAG